MKLGPEGTAVSSSKLGLLSLATMGAGALAGFIGFGNGLLFATMLIVGLGHPLDTLVRLNASGMVLLPAGKRDGRGDGHEGSNKKNPLVAIQLPSSPQGS